MFSPHLSMGFPIFLFLNFPKTYDDSSIVKPLALPEPPTIICTLPCPTQYHPVSQGILLSRNPLTISYHKSEKNCTADLTKEVCESILLLVYC